MYETLTPWHDVADTFDLTSNPPENPFQVFSSILQDLGIGELDALNIFTADYYRAETWFSTYGEVLDAFLRVEYNIRQKYEFLIDSYPFNTLKERKRTPNITHSMSASSSGSADVQRRQTETVQETPPTDITRTHSVSPYDSSTVTVESEDKTKQTGNRTVSTSYTGQPDHTASSSSGSRTDTETGTETVTEKTVGKPGQSIGETLSDYEMANSIFKMLCQEIAKKIFLQVWR